MMRSKKLIIGQKHVTLDRDSLKLKCNDLICMKHEFMCVTQFALPFRCSALHDPLASAHTRQDVAYLRAVL